MRTPAESRHKHACFGFGAWRVGDNVVPGEAAPPGFIRRTHATHKFVFVFWPSQKKCVMRHSHVKFFSTLWLVGGILFSGSRPAAAQRPAGWCGQEIMTQQLLQAHPDAIARTRELARQLPQAPQPEGSVRIIPVVVHVLHQDGNENISDQVIQQGIAKLNEDFRALNSDTAQVRSLFKPLIADMNFEFRLAKIDPDGYCTNGIVRHYTGATDAGGDNAIKAFYWPTNRYLNIYVVKKIQNSQSGTILGYAYLPHMAANQKRDGVVVVYYEMDNQNRTLTHEVGHYLGLWHTFQGGCTATNDGVDDTPPTQGSNFGSGCNPSQNTCSIDSPDLPDQWENYMDYSDCPRMFTLGQKQRVDMMFSNYRTYLSSTANLQATGVYDNNYTCKPWADFEVSKPVVCAGEQVQLLNTSRYKGSVSFSWDLPGATPSSSTAASPTVTYSAAGVYSVSLTVTQGSESKTKTDAKAVTVLPGSSLINHQAWIDPIGNTMADWQLPVNEMGHAWEVTNRAAFSSPYSLYFNNYQKGEKGEQVSFYLPPVDITRLDEKILRFKYAYAQYDGKDKDMLVVFGSKDCGKTWAPLWYREGSQLATVPGLVLQSFKPTSASQWDSVEINLAARYPNEQHVLIRFEFRSGKQNNIYVDDIQFGRNLTGIGDGFGAYAPAVMVTSEKIYAVGYRRPPVIELIHADGRLAARRQTFSMDLRGRPAGAYWVRVIGTDGTVRTKRVLIR